MKCAVCNSEINEGARLCPVCRSHQSAFLRTLFYIAGIAGVLSLLASAVVFVISKAGEVKKEILWHDHLKLISFNSDGPQVFLNDGDGEIFLSHVSIKASNKNESTRFINTIAEPKKVLNFKAQSDMPQPVSPVTLQENKNENIKPYRNTSCVAWSYFSLADPGWLQYRNFLGEQLVSVDAEATIYYYSVHNGQEGKITFPARGILFRSMAKECSEIINKMAQKQP